MLKLPLQYKACKLGNPSTMRVKEGSKIVKINVNKSVENVGFIYVFHFTTTVASSIISAQAMKSSMVAFLIISMVSGQNIREWRQHRAGFTEQPQMLPSSLNSVLQNKPPFINNFELINFLSNGLTPTNPGLDLLNHGLGFGMAALRGLGSIIQNYEKNQVTQ